MKLALSLTLSFLLFAFITKLPLAFSNDVEPVLDTKGNPLVSGVEYYIMPSIWGPPGGGLQLGITGDLECPVTVLQDFREVFQGIPVIFSRIPETSVGTIFIGIPLYINFPEPEKPDCAESSRWLVFVDNDIEKTCVGIGGPENYPGKKIVSGFFNIQKTSLIGYKLQFRATDSPTSLDIGRYHNDDEVGRRLILTEQEGEAFEVVFIPASSYNINNDDGIIKSVA